jgi:hypothetical protein
MIIDPNQFRWMYLSMDGVYFYDFSPNEEDKTYCKKNFKGYGYWDVEPQRVAFTMYHPIW